MFKKILKTIKKYSGSSSNRKRRRYSRSYSRSSSDRGRRRYAHSYSRSSSDRRRHNPYSGSGRYKRRGRSSS